MRVRKVTLTARYMILKAGLVTLLSLAASRLPGLGQPVTIAFAALLSIPPAFYRGVRSGLRNFYVTIIGAAAGMGMVAALRHDVLAIPPGIMLVCLLCYLCGWTEYFPLGAFTLLVVSYYPAEEIWAHSLRRALQVAAGIAIAMAVNWTVSRFRYRDLYLSQFLDLLRGAADSVGRMADCFRAGDADGMARLEWRFHRLFRQINLAIDEVADLKKELRVRRESGGLSYVSTVWLARLVDKLAAVAHYSWDIVALSPEILRAGELPPPKKAELDRAMGSVALRLSGIVAAFEEPPGAAAGLGAPAHRNAPFSGREDGLDHASLLVSIRQLERETAELAELAGLFAASFSPRAS